MNFFFVYSGDKRSEDVKEWVKGHAYYLANYVANTGADIQPVNHPSKAHCIVVVGGDGTMLHAINKYHRYKKPFFGIDRGTLGFLLNPVKRRNDLIRVLENIAGYAVVELQLIKATFTKHSGKKVSSLAFNDVYVESRAMLSGTVEASGEFGFEHFFRGNGIIVSSPQGSTAYNRSAGGQILPLEEKLLAVTSICSQVRPIRDVVKMDKVTIKVERGKAFATADNRRIPNVKRVVVRQSGKSVKVIFTPESDFQLKRFHVEEEMKARLKR